MTRVGLKNIEYISEILPTFNYEIDMLEVSVGEVLTKENIIHLNNFFLKSNPKKVNLQIQKEDHLRWLHLFEHKNIEVWLELKTIEKNTFKVLEKLSNIKTFVLNLKRNDISPSQNKNIEELIGKENYLKFDEIYIVDTNLYDQNNTKSNLFLLREKLISSSKNSIKYCKEFNDIYFVYDFKSNKFNPCIDLNVELDNIKEVFCFQNKTKPHPLCNYFCNEYIYPFEEKLKRRTK